MRLEGRGVSLGQVARDLPGAHKTVLGSVVLEDQGLIKLITAAISHCVFAGAASRALATIASNCAFPRRDLKSSVVSRSF